MPEGDEQLVAQVNVRVTQSMLDSLDGICGEWIPRALVARKAMEIGLRHLMENPDEVGSLQRRRPGPKPRGESDDE